MLGATGQLGLFCITHLLGAGCRVTAVLREAPSSRHTSIPGLERCALENAPGNGGTEKVAAQPATSAESADGRLSLLSCGPMELAGSLLASTTGGERPPWSNVVVVSTTSIETKRQSPSASERRQVGEIEACQKRIAETCNAAGIPHIVLFPTMIYGCGMDQNVSRLYRLIQRFGWMIVSGRAGGRRQPLHVDDLAKTCVNAVMLGEPLTLETPVCGGSVLTYREMVLRILESANRGGRLVSLPGPLVSTAARIVGTLQGQGDQLAAMVRRQAVDQVFDDTPARQHLSHVGRPFAPRASDFTLPAEQERILYALQRQEA